jgi:Uma2 family endonuclease
MGTRTFLTTDELERLPKPDQGGGYELDEGEPVYVSPNSFQQGKIILRIYMYLEEWAKAYNRGLVAPDTWFELASGVVRAPDVAYIQRERISGLDPKHTLKVIPALVVEVLSSFNTAREMTRKIKQYRDAGVDLIWVVDPEKSEVDIHGKGPLKTLRRGDFLKDDQILPGLSISVTAIFEPVL